MQVGDLMWCKFAIPGPCILLQQMPEHGFWKIWWHGGESLMSDIHLEAISASG